MKTIALIFLLAAFALEAQQPTSPATTNRDDDLRRALRMVTEGRTNNAPAASQTPRIIPPPPSTTVITPTAVATNAPPSATAIPAAPPTTAPTTPPSTATPIPTAPPPPLIVEDPTLDQILVKPKELNLTAATLDQVLQIYSEYVGRTVIRQATLPAVTIVLQNQTPLTKRETIQALNAVLAVNGISMINVGDKFVKAVPVAQAGNAGARLGTNDASTLPELGSYITHVIQLKYARPSEMIPILQPFASAGMAPPMGVEGSGLLVLRDNAENVKRMLEMIEKVDVTIESAFESKVVPIKFAKAEEIAAALNSLSGGGGGTTVGGQRGANAQRSGLSGTSGTGYGRPGVASPMGGQYPGQTGLPGTTTPGGAGAALGGASSFSDRLRNIVQRASASGDLTILGQTKIIADTRSNSLLIFAMHQDMVMIMDIIAKLDVVLYQVLIESIIMDVALDHSWALGVTAGQPPTTSGKLQTGGVYNNPSSSNPLSTLGQFFSGAVSNSTFPTTAGLSYFGKYNGDIEFVVQAAAADSRINVIQKPRIQTSHATRAAIFVGNTVPYVSSTYYGGGYAGGPSSSYQQLQVGIGLDVTPFINQDGLVLMQIDQTIDEISGSTDIQGVGAVPNTTHRTLSSEVAVLDREIIMLGGFIRSSDNASKSGIPLLKDIPIFGVLFSSRSMAKERKELIVLMRPTVLRTPELAAAHVEEEKQLMPGVREAEKQAKRMEDKGMREMKMPGRSSTPPRDDSSSNTTKPAPPVARDPNSPFSPDELKLFSSGSSTNVITLQ